MPMMQRLPGHLWLVTLWDADSQSSEKVLKIRDEEAFPPSHPTTRLGLALLREICAARPINKVLDVGCGSGLLGLAAAALGAPRVLSLDIAGRAAQATRDNARGNHLAGAVQVIQGSTECVRESFELVLANLPWEVQMDKAPDLDRLASPQGALMLSGFRDNQEKPLLENYRQRGWSLVRRLVKEFEHPELPPHLSFTWVAWVLQRSV